MSSLWLLWGYPEPFPHKHTHVPYPQRYFFGKEGIFCACLDQRWQTMPPGLNSALPIFGLWRKIFGHVLCDMKITWNSNFSGHKFCWDTDIRSFGFCMLGLQSWVFETVYGPQKLNCTLAPYRKGIWPLTYINSRGYVKCAYCKI